MFYVAMFNQVWWNLSRSIGGLIEACDRVPVTYRAGGCLLLGLLLMWEATKVAGYRDRKFFVTGFVALAFLGLGAAMFVQN